MILLCYTYNVFTRKKIMNKVLWTNTSPENDLISVLYMYNALF